MQTTKSLKELISLALLYVFNVEKHKDENIVYAAEDGNVFIDENRAKIHCKEKELKYHPITRTEAETGKIDVQKNDGDDDADDLEAETAEKTKELQELDIENADYQKLKELTLFFQLEPENMKAPTLKVALTEYKTKISE
ncbi:MAG: hypothetical protein QM564_11085 [Bergeyella sp.]